MNVFLDFEASSPSDRSYPIEVAGVFEDGAYESHLIIPAAGWSGWDDAPEVIHGIDRATLAAEGATHDRVAQRMVHSIVARSDRRASGQPARWCRAHDAVLALAGQPS